MIHGWSSSWYALSPLIPLVARRYRCVAVDLPGYGSSEHLHGPTTIDRYVDLLAMLIQELTDSPAVLIGHSMGGMISATLAMRYPQLVERTVLICPTISGDLSTWIKLFISPSIMLQRFRVADSIVSAIEPYMLSVIDRLMRPASFAARSEISEEAYLRLRADARRPGQGRVRAETYLAMRNHDLRGKLGQIETPSLVIWGAEDNTVPLRDAGVVADEWRNVDLRIVPKAGHWPHFETPDITIKMVASYLGLPLITTRLEDSTSPSEVVSLAAEFLQKSDICSGMTLAQRTRLAAQCRMRVYAPGTVIALPNEESSDLLIVQEGAIEIWSGTVDDDPATQKLLSQVFPGQITGEMSLIDGGRRSAEMRAGEHGCTLLAITRARMFALAEDDPALGNAMIWNIASSLALRIRLTNWQQQMMADQMQAMQAGESGVGSRESGVGSQG
ncbi:alpha/beta fold hydrolase [Chloroflexales bacterium ZM16-3]|nr:alpha/beta fold hydrolase [Chloroflexales bacterium ZM16-3]